MVGVAQLVEPLIVVQVVVGSSPIAHPIFRGNSFELPLFFYLSVALTLQMP